MKKQGKKMRQGILKARQAGSGARIGAPLAPPPLPAGMIEPFKFGDAEKRELTVLRLREVDRKAELRRAEVAAGGYFVQLKNLEGEFQRMSTEHIRGLQLLAGAVQELGDLVGESGGVYGLHLNGDPAPWEDILEGGRFERLVEIGKAHDWLEEKRAEYADMLEKQSAARQDLDSAVREGRFRLRSVDEGRVDLSVQRAAPPDPGAQKPVLLECPFCKAAGVRFPGSVVVFECGTRRGEDKAVDRASDCFRRTHQEKAPPGVVRAEVGEPVDFGDGVLEPGE